MSSIFQKHNPNHSQDYLPVSSSIDSRESLKFRQGAAPVPGIHRDQSISLSEKLLVSPSPTLSHFTPKKLDEMIPFPCFPYSYVNLDSKDVSQPHSYGPYFIPPPIPGMMPNYQPSTSVDTTANSTTLNSTIAPAVSIPIYGAMPRPASFVGHNSAVGDPPAFGPGPPIVTGERLKGPRGCNLFVFHLPNEITNWDLYLLFRRFGTILSVHIMVNKTTGLSKGYGFVSFAFAEDASAAIELMDGFRLGKKRLKVQLKRLQDDCTDDDDSNWMNPADGEESNCNSTSTENTLSPEMTRNMHEILSSGSSDGETQTDVAIELHHDEVHTPIRVASSDCSGKLSNKSNPNAEMSLSTDSIPLRA